MGILRRLISSLTGGSRRTHTSTRTGGGGVSGGLLGAIRGFFRGSSGRRV